MVLKREPGGSGGPLGAAWRAFCRATELPGEHCLPDTLRRARSASGRGDPESQWALRQYEALRQSLEQEKQTLTQLLVAAGLTFWGALALGVRRPLRGPLRLIAPLNALLALALALRILMVNLLLRRFWERPADD
jgi:hypothetical protein